MTVTVVAYLTALSRLLNDFILRMESVRQETPHCRACTSTTAVFSYNVTVTTLKTRHKRLAS